MLIIGLGLIIVPRFFYRHEAGRNDLEKGIPVFVGIGMTCMSLPPLLLGVFGLLAPLLR